MTRPSAPGPHLSGAILSATGAEPAQVTLDDLPATDSARYSAFVLIGTGGMGRVFTAHDSVLNRQVAFKEPRPDANIASPEARLIREARLTAAIGHTGVLPIFDLGRTLDGRLYYTMPLAAGRTLADAIADSPGDNESRAPLLRRVLEACEAVGAAHRRAIIHRDIKPANIMVSDTEGTRVLDWGLARQLYEPSTGPEALVAAVPDAQTQAVGTARYMSPEQAAGRDLDARTDVYSLGVVLFEVVTGAAWDRTMSTLATVAPPALAAIVGRATASDRRLRYQDAAALGEDLARYLDGRRVTAYSYPPRELLARLIRAWRIPLSAIAVAVVAATSLVAIAWYRLAEESARAIAAEQRTSDALATSRAALARSPANEAMLQARAGVRGRAELLAAESLTIGESSMARGILAMFGSGGRPVLRSVEPMPDCRHRVFSPDGSQLACAEGEGISVRARSPLRQLWPVDGLVCGMAFAAGYLAIIATDRTLSWRDPETGQVLSSWPHMLCAGRIEGFEDMAVLAGPSCFAWYDGPQTPFFPIATCTVHSIRTALAIAPDPEQWFATCSDGTWQKGRLDDPNATETFPAPAGLPTVLTLQYTLSGSLVAGLANGDIAVLSASRTAIARQFSSGLTRVTRLVAAPDSDLVIASGTTGPGLIIEPNEDLVRGPIPGNARDIERFHGDELFCVAGDELHRWHIPLGAPTGFEAQDGITSLDISEDGARLGIKTIRSTRIRSLVNGALLAGHQTKDRLLKAGVFSWDGDVWLDVSANRQDLIYRDSRTLMEVKRHEHGFGTRRAVSLGDLVYLVPDSLGGFWVYPTDPQGERLPIENSALRYMDLSSHPSTGLAAGLRESDRVIVLIDGATSKSSNVARDPEAFAVVTNAGGELVVSAERDRIKLWRGKTGELLLSSRPQGKVFIDVAISPDSDLIAAGTLDGYVYTGNSANVLPVVELEAHQEKVSSVLFSPDGKQLLTASWDRHVRIFELNRLQEPPAALLQKLQFMTQDRAPLRLDDRVPRGSPPSADSLPRVP